jgi:hypothetical protein
MGTLSKLVSKQAHWNCLTLSCALCEFYLFMQIDRIKCTIPICVDNLQSMSSKIFNMVMRVECSLPTMMHSALYIYVQKWWHIFNHITLKLIKVLNDLGELSHSAQANVLCNRCATHYLAQMRSAPWAPHHTPLHPRSLPLSITVWGNEIHTHYTKYLHEVIGASVAARHRNKINV